ncbi:hypothetical protein D4764_13G0002650 [Takifugu flavidus]|uniref:Uncharacterized protein n=1 Tax=Takifugu flavidus TaxID=433684 RepID=A0A5C6P806_9TELE|nr:hypothetical protein D4764_13G0002650 [Takifugu flavidus]
MKLSHLDLPGYLIQPEKPQRAREAHTEWEAGKRGGEADVEKSEVVWPFPVTRETNASFKEKKNSQ